LVHKPTFDEPPKGANDNELAWPLVHGIAALLGYAGASIFARRIRRLEEAAGWAGPGPQA